MGPVRVLTAVLLGIAAASGLSVNPAAGGEVTSIDSATSPAAMAKEDRVKHQELESLHANERSIKDTATKRVAMKARVKQLKQKAKIASELHDKKLVYSTKAKLKQLHNKRLQKQFQQGSDAMQKGSELIEKSKLGEGTKTTMMKKRLQAMKGQVKSFLFLGELNKVAKKAAELKKEELQHPGK